MVELGNVEGITVIGRDGISDIPLIAGPADWSFTPAAVKAIAEALSALPEDARVEFTREKGLMAYGEKLNCDIVLPGSDKTARTLISIDIRQLPKGFKYLVMTTEEFRERARNILKELSPLVGES